MKNRTFVWLLLGILVLGIVFPVLAEKKTELIMWTKEGDPVYGEIVKICKDFSAKNPEYSVQVINYNVEDLRTNFQSAAFAGNGPDLLWTVSDHAGPFVTMGLIDPVDKIFGAKYEAKFVKPGIEAVKLNGKTWGVPITVGNHLMLMYNKKLLPTPPKDTNELIAVAKKLTVDSNNDGNPEQYGFVFNLNEPFWLAPWLGGFGGWPLEGNKPTLDSKGMTGALQFVQDLKWKHKIVPMEADYNGADSMFKEGKAAMVINGDWSLFSYVDDKLKDKVSLGIARIPKVSATGIWPSPMTSGTYFMVPNYVDKTKLTGIKKLVDYFISKETQIYFLKNHKRLPSIVDATNDPALKNDPLMQGSMDQMVVGKPMPTVPEMRACWDAMRPNLEAVMANKMTPQDAAKAMQEAAEKAIREMNK